MPYITFPSLSNLLSLCSKTPLTESITSTKLENQDDELLQMLNQQKQINDLVYVWDLDSKGKLHSRWLKASTPITPKK